MIDQDTINAILHMKEQGIPQREIARCVLGRSSRESTVRDIINRDREQKFSGMDLQSSGPKKKVDPNPAKILIVDIETAPCIGYYWRRWKENISQAQAISESYMLTWAAKWLDSTEIMSDSLVHHETYQYDPEDDSMIVASLADLIDQADMVVAHNGRRFDIPVLKTRMLSNGMVPLMPYRLIDTLDIAKREFRFPSNSLDSLAQYLGFETKMSHGGFKLWRGCIEGCKESWEEMLAYNIQDIRVLENVYLALRAWYGKHPNVALYGTLDKHVCPCCGSDDLEPTGQYDTTNVSKFPVYSCKSCGAVKSTRFTVLDKKQRSNILRNVRS